MRQTVIILLTILSGLSLYAQPQMPQTIIFGTVYDVFHERYDTDKEYQEIVTRDIKLIKSTGINTVLP